MNFNLGEVVEATGGRLICGRKATKAGRICTDTRTLQEGDTFLALDGKNFRGADFISHALSKGAAGVIATCALPETFPRNRFYIQVKNSLNALGDVAREWRKVVDPIVIAVTGSAGKTTTKEMLAFICKDEMNTLYTEGNYNNLIGLPLTLLRLKEEHELAIVEVGMSIPGELTELTNICLPDVAVITNIGNAHIGNFGSLSGLVKGEAEIFEAMPKEGTAIINADCPHASIMAETFEIPEMVICYGQNERADVRAMNLRISKPYGYQFDLKIIDVVKEVHLKVFGRYQVSNAIAAAAAAARVGIDPEIIAERLQEFDAPKMRSTTEWFDGIFMITDCYNASPDAMITSLKSINDVSGLKRRVALLGDMLELGDHTERFHRQVGLAAAEAKLDFVCTVGESAHYITDEAERRGVAAQHFLEGADAAHFLHRILEPNDALIVKGSRGARLEMVLAKLKEIRSEARLGIIATTQPEEYVAQQ